MSQSGGLGAIISGLFKQIAHVWNLALHSGFPLIFWVQPRWSVDEMTDQSGKVRMGVIKLSSDHPHYRSKQRDWVRIGMGVVRGWGKGVPSLSQRRKGEKGDRVY